MVSPTSDQVIVQAWEADGRPVPYPDYKQSYLANNGQWQPASGSSARALTPPPKQKASYQPGTSDEWFGTLATLPGADVRASPSDGSLDYYRNETAKIDEALASPAVSAEKRAELRQTQAQLDAEFQPQRAKEATTTLQNAGSDADALKALQALEGLRTNSSGAVGGSYTDQRPSDGSQTINGKRVDPALAKNGPVYDPSNVEAMRQEWINDGFQARGVSFEEYQQMVKDANPNGSLRYTSPTAKNIGRGGSAKTFSLNDDPFAYQTNGQSAAAQTALRNAEITQQGNLGYFDNITGRALGDLSKKNKETDAESKRVLDLMEKQGAGYKDSNNAYVKELRDAATSSNAESRASSERLTGAVNKANSENYASLGAYQSGVQPYKNVIAGTTRQNVQFDPEGLAAQRASLAQAQAIAGGSLDYQSQAAQAYANPEDIARALEGIGMLRENALNGGKDQKENLAIARKEFAEGGKNQQEVLDRFREISRPEMTAEERNILAQSQRQFAIHDKANRDAVSRDLEARGVMSGAGQIAQQQSAQQQMGEERVAGTLGAQAQAVQRAVTGLQGMHASADSLRTGNQNAEQLMQSAANALRQGDLEAANAFTVAAQRQREQGFNEEYARGVGADNASANNQSTRLGGAGIQANQANAIRSANDSVNMFNNEQQGITDRYNTSFKQSEYERLTGLEQQGFENRNTTTNGVADREERLNVASQGAITDRFGRTNTGVQTGIGVNSQNWGIDSVNGGNRLGENSASQGRTERETGTRIDTAGRRTDLSSKNNKDVQDALAGLSGARYGI